MWFGVNTICVDGRTTTLVGSSFWGGDLVEAMRDNMLETLREIMSHHADAKGDLKMPTYQKATHATTTTKESSTLPTYEVKVDVQ
jgi:hypothetical protein